MKYCFGFVCRGHLTALVLWICVWFVFPKPSSLPKFKLIMNIHENT